MITEKQFFFQNKLYLLIAVILVFITINHFTKTNRALNDIINHSIPILILLSILFLSLRISITKYCISYQWKWLSIRLQKNLIPINSIIEIKVVRYSFIDGGLGYGIRYSPKYGNVVNVYGNKGLFIKTNNKKLMIGIQKTKIIEEFISKTFT